MDEEQLKREVRQLLLVGPYLESFIKKYYSDKTVLSENILEKLKRGDLDKIKDKIRKPDLEDRENPRPDWEFEGEKYSYLLELKCYKVYQLRYSDISKNEKFISETFGEDSMEIAQDLKLPLDMIDLDDSKILGSSKVYMKLNSGIPYDKVNLKKLTEAKKFKKQVLQEIQKIINKRLIIENVLQKKIPPNKVKSYFYYNGGEFLIYQEESGDYAIMPPVANFFDSEEDIPRISQKVKEIVEEAEKKFDHKEYEQHKKILTIFIDLFPLTLDVWTINFFDSLLKDIRSSKNNKVEYADWNKNSEKIMPFPPSCILFLFSFR
jgi:hypothetical protein